MTTEVELNPFIDQNQPHKLYWTRWLVLMSFSFLNASNAAAWITFAPISTNVQARYGISVSLVNLLANTYPIVYIPLVPFTSYLCDKRGLRLVVLVGGAFTTAGVWIRCLPHYYLVFLGQLSCGVGNTFLLSVPVKIAANWFGEKERTTATSIGAMFNTIGVALGFELSPLLAPTEGDIPRMLLIEAIGVSVIFAVVLGSIRSSHPPTPPSKSTASEKLDFREGIKAIFKNFNFLLLAAAYGLGVGTHWAFTTVLCEILSPFGYSEIDCGTFGVILTVVGLIGASVMSFITDKTKFYKWITVTTFVGSLAASFIFGISLRPNSFFLVALAIATFGFFVTAIVPVSLETAVESSYPMPEGLSASFMTLIPHIMAIPATLIFEALLRIRPIATVYFLLSVYFVSSILVLVYHCEYRRFIADQAKTQDKDQEMGPVVTTTE